MFVTAILVALRQRRLARAARLELEALDDNGLADIGLVSGRIPAYLVTGRR